MPDNAIIQVWKDHAIPVGEVGENVLVTVLDGATVYYGDRQVTPFSNLGSLTVGQSVTLAVPGNWLISASLSEVRLSATSRTADTSNTATLGSDFTVGGLGGSPLTSLVANAVPPWASAARAFSDRLLDGVSVLDNLSQAEINDARSYTGSIDVTAKVQAIADYLAGQHGGTIKFPPGKYQINSLQLPLGVSMAREGYMPGNGLSASAPQPYQIYTPNAAGWTVEVAAGNGGGYIAGLTFTGPGAGSQCGAIHFKGASFRGGVVGCFITQYSEWGILQEAGEGASVFADNLIFNTLLDRTRSIDQTTLPHGAIELRGNDNWVIGGEYGVSAGLYPNATFNGQVGSAGLVTGTAQAGAASNAVLLAAGESATTNAYAGYLVEITAGTGVGQVQYGTAYNGSTKALTVFHNWLTPPDATSIYLLTPLRCFAAAFKADSWVFHGIYEISEAGIWLANGTSPHRLVSVQADQNSGPGFVLAGGCRLDSTTIATRNSKAVDGGYDGVLIANASSMVVEASDGNIASDVNQPRHMIHAPPFPIGDDGNRAVIKVGARGSALARRGKIVKVESSIGQATVDLPDGVINISSNSATPSVDGFRQVRFANGSATTVTQLQDVVDGVYTLLSGNANTILQNNSSIVTAGAADLPMLTNKAYQFFSFQGIFYQLGNRDGFSALSGQNAMWATDDTAGAATGTGVQIGSNPAASAPGTLSSATPSTTGGTLAAATYFYKIAPYTTNGVGLPTNELSATTTGSTGSVALVWTASSGATGYRVYRGTSAGGENVYYDAGLSTTYTDTNAGSSAGVVEGLSRSATVGIGPGRIWHSAAWSLRTDSLLDFVRNADENMISGRVSGDAQLRWVHKASNLYLADGTNALSMNMAPEATNKRLLVTGAMRATDGVIGKNLTGAGKTTVVDGDFTATPVDGAMAVHYDSTAGKAYLSVRTNGSWKVMVGPV